MSLTACVIADSLSRHIRVSGKSNVFREHCGVKVTMLRGEGHSAAGWDIAASVKLLLWVQSPVIRPLTAPCHLLLVLVSTAPRHLLLVLGSTQLQIVNCCCAFILRGGI